MDEYQDRGENRDTTSQCRSFGQCNLYGSKELMKCGDDFDPQYSEKCKKRISLIKKSRSNGGLHAKVK